MSGSDNMADRVYAHLKAAIFALRLLPGERFSENEIAKRMQVSRTPVRQALYRLQKEGYIQVMYRSGWQVSPFDVTYFEELYEVRLVLEAAAINRLCDGTQQHPEFKELLTVWLVPPTQRLMDGQQVARLDEQFHDQLVSAAGNGQMAAIYRQVSERIRLIRLLAFTEPERINASYEEHAAILRAILKRRNDEAIRLLNIHIAVSKAEVRKITLHRLQTAREQLQSGVKGSETGSRL